MKSKKEKLDAMEAWAKKALSKTMEDLYAEGRGIFSQEYWKAIKPTYIENWPKALTALSFRQKRIKLSMKQARALGSNITELGESFGGKQDIADIEQSLDRAVKSFPSGAFVRLGSRSPKDAYVEERDSGFRVTSGAQAIKVLTGGSERMYEDLHTAFSKNYTPSIFVREFMVEIALDPGSEFRCFAVDRKLRGISQYNYHETYKDIHQDKKKYISEIRKFFKKKFTPACPIASVVFDVFVGDKKVVLVEINPLFDWTDPCLFRGSKLDGTFRYNVTKVETAPL